MHVMSSVREEKVHGPTWTNWVSDPSRGCRVRQERHG